MVVKPSEIPSQNSPQDSAHPKTQIGTLQGTTCGMKSPLCRPTQSLVLGRCAQQIPSNSSPTSTSKLQRIMAQITTRKLHEFSSLQPTLPRDAYFLLCAQPTRKNPQITHQSLEHLPNKVQITSLGWHLKSTECRVRFSHENITCSTTLANMSLSSSVLCKSEFKMTKKCQND